MGFGRQTSLVPKAGSFKNSPYEFYAFRLGCQDNVGMLHEGGKGDTVGGGRLVACVVNKINGSWLGHEVDSGNDDD